MREGSSVWLRAVLAMASVAAALALAPSMAHAEGTYVALGDSVGTGAGASNSSKGYVGLLHSALAANASVTTLSNHSEGGASSLSIRTGGQLANAIGVINDPTDTKYVTIDIGGNDLLGGGCSNNWDTCSFRSNFSQTLDDLLAALSGDPGTETLATMAYYNPGSGLGNATEESYDLELLGTNKTLNATDTGADIGLNDVILQESQSRGLPMANPYQRFKDGGQAFIANDELHPNDSGYAAIAAAFCDVVAAMCATAPPPPAGDADPPQTTLTKSPRRKSSKRRVRFAFSSNEAGSTFECRLDDSRFEACASPLRERVKRGRHRFLVRAVDAAGNVDPSPATVRFRVKRKR